MIRGPSSLTCGSTPGSATGRGPSRTRATRSGSGRRPSDPRAGRRQTRPAPVAPAGPPAGPPPARPADRVGTDDPDPVGVAGAPLRLIGLVEAHGRAGRVAVVTDERGVYHGLAGDAIEGRYRIVSIDETSIEVEDLTRGARMTLSLSES